MSKGKLWATRCKDDHPKVIAVRVHTDDLEDKGN